MPRDHSKTFPNSPCYCCALWAISTMWFVAGWSPADEPSLDRAALDRAVTLATSYLSQEVASWKEEHNCYSCHNHGDGARALIAARGAKLDVPARPIEIAVNWLRVPDEWDHNGPDGPFSDRQLARIQFAAALTQAIESGVILDREPLERCAKQLVREQSTSGAWDFEGSDAIGGSTTYGRALATVLAQHTLRTAGASEFADPIRRADEWLRASNPRSVVDAAAVLRGLRGASDKRAAALRTHCRDLLLRGQRDEGGWGPYVLSGPEAFDTALAVWALNAEPDAAGRRSVERGRSYLVRLQQSDGSWPETTRPLPRESYSQRISTTAWALLALIESQASGVASAHR